MLGSNNISYDDWRTLWYKIISMITVIRDAQVKSGYELIIPTHDSVYDDIRYKQSAVFGLLEMDSNLVNIKSPPDCHFMFRQNPYFDYTEYTTNGMVKLLSIIENEPSAQIIRINNSVFIGLTMKLGFDKLFQIYQILLNHASLYMSVK
jgi:hypothetical protein